MGAHEELHHWDFIRAWLCGQAARLGVEPGDVDDLVQLAIVDYLDAVAERAVKHPLSYMRRCLASRHAKARRHAGVVERHAVAVAAHVRAWAVASSE